MAAIAPQLQDYSPGIVNDAANRFESPTGEFVVRFSFGLLLIATSISGVVAPFPGRAALGAEDDGSRDAWARFAPGDWKSVCVTTQSFDADGKLASTSTTSTKTSLTGIEESCVCLKIEVEVEVAGKNFKNPPQFARQGFTGGPCARDTQVTTMKPVELRINGRMIPCRVERQEYETTEGVTSVVVYTSDEVAPYVLQRESVTKKPDSDTVVSKTTMQVIALDMPTQVMTEIKPAAVIKVVDERPTGKIVTIAHLCQDVPGGTIWQTSKETNKMDMVVRRSILDLVDYGTNGTARPTRAFPRLRGGRLFRRSAQ